MKFLHRNFSGKVVHCNDLTASLTVKFLSEFSKFLACIISGPEWIPKWDHLKLSLSSCKVSWKGIRSSFTQQFGTNTGLTRCYDIWLKRGTEVGKCHPQASILFKSRFCSYLLFPLLSALKIVELNWKGDHVKALDDCNVFSGVSWTSWLQNLSALSQ